MLRCAFPRPGRRSSAPQHFRPRGVIFREVQAAGVAQGPPPTRSFLQNGVRVHPQLTHVFNSLVSPPPAFRRFRPCFPETSAAASTRLSPSCFLFPPRFVPNPAAPTEISGGGSSPAACAAICAICCICCGVIMPIPGCIGGIPIWGGIIPGMPGPCIAAIPLSLGGTIPGWNCLGASAGSGGWLGPDGFLCICLCIEGGAPGTAPIAAAPPLASMYE